MKNIKFVVKVNRAVLTLLNTSSGLTGFPSDDTNRKLLCNGQIYAEDAVKSMQNSHCNPELVSVRVSA